jgi:hypothetical protein
MSSNLKAQIQIIRLQNKKIKSKTRNSNDKKTTKVFYITIINDIY